MKVLDTVDLRREERVAWVCLALMLGIVGWSIGRVVPRDPKPTPQKHASSEETWGRIEALEARVEEQARIRCLTVNTDRLDLMIVPGTNVGKVRVKPPAPPPAPREPPRPPGSGPATR